ncbi:MAG: hypothetical protein AABZ24_09560 [Nitrospirota bacterium]
MDQSTFRIPGKRCCEDFRSLSYSKTGLVRAAETGEDHSAFIDELVIDLPHTLGRRIPYNATHAVSGLMRVTSYSGYRRLIFSLLKDVPLSEPQ